MGELICRARVLVLGYSRGHDWKKIGGNMRACRRCSANGWVMPGG